MKLRRTLTILLPLAALGCGSGRGAPEPAPVPEPSSAPPATGAALPGRYTGHFEFDFERQVFQPCGMREEWWAWGAPAELQRTWGQRTFLVLEGEVSGRGSFGHMGRYPRQIRITAILRQEPGEGEGCASSTVAHAAPAPAARTGADPG